MYLAHSKNHLGFDQPYSEHVKNVVLFSLERFRFAAKHSNMSETTSTFLKEVLEISAYWHDLGKLDDNCQKILRGESDGKMLNHVDAGVSILLKKYLAEYNLVYLYAAVLVYAHHIGLPDRQDVIENTTRNFFEDDDVQYLPIKDFIRDVSFIKEIYGIDENKTVSEYVDDNLEKYIKIHNNEVGVEPIPSKLFKLLPPDIRSEDFRMIFSCLVDADHTDTGNFFSGILHHTKYKLSPKRRQLALTKSVNNIISKASSGRKRRREKLYSISKRSSFDNFVFNKATVGCGKTISNMALALRMATKNSCDRIFVIAPYINIISQTVGVYRNSVVLKDEDDDVINEIHGKVEYETPELRNLSKMWDSPINVSTAVQFFESLFTNKTSKIRKYHLFANSVVIIDEYDKAMPHFNWGVTMHTLTFLSKRYNIHFIFSSGTPVNYFDIFDMDKTCKDLIGNKFFNQLKRAEKNRIKFSNIGKIHSIESLKESIFASNKDSVLVVLNTVINSHILTKSMVSDCRGYKIFQLSSAFTPNDKEIILEEVKDLLKKKEKIILIATSIVECGVDFSFQEGFRESAGILNVLQFSGRINRDEENNRSFVNVFSFDENLFGNTDILTENPETRIASSIFTEYLNRGKTSPNYCQECVQREVDLDSKIYPINFISNNENFAFKTIGDNFKVIPDQTVSVIVYPDIINKLKNKAYITATEIDRGSVQIYLNKFEDIKKELGIIQEFETSYGEKLYFWNSDYCEKLFGIGHGLETLRRIKLSS